MLTLDDCIEAEGTNKVAVSRDLGIGLTTLWRAQRGEPISPKNARKLCGRFPGLSYERLTLGAAPDSPVDPTAADASSSA